MFYDREGKPLARERYGELFEDKQYRTVAFDLLEGNESDDPKTCAWVSTIWLGFDLFNSDARPQIFETRSFRKGRECDQLRYATETEALAGHRQVAELMRVVVEAERYALAQAAKKHD